MDCSQRGAVFTKNRINLQRSYGILRTEYQNVIAIDMGIKHIATSVELASNRTVFYGKDLIHVRGWYFWLRRQLGVKKAIDTIKKIGDHEKRIANNMYIKSLEIVNRALETIR